MQYEYLHELLQTEVVTLETPFLSAGGPTYSMSWISIFAFQIEIP